MRIGVAGLTVLLLGTGGVALAQPQPLVGQPGGTSFTAPSLVAQTDGAFVGGAEAKESCARTWISADYLLWWIKKGPQSDPLVTTSSASGLTPGDGAIGSPGTSVALGGNGLSFGSLSGVRLTTGSWLDSSSTIGLEGSGFFLFRSSMDSTAASGGSGSPLIAIPYRDATSGTESAAFVSLPGFVAGRVDVNSSTRLWGAEANGIYNVYRCDMMEVDLLLGFRYVDLLEKLTIIGTSTPVGPGLADLNFNGGFVGFPTTVQTTDSFQTRNQFYGGQVGARTSWNLGRLSLDLQGKVALGETQQTINIGGTTATFLPGVNGPTQGAPAFFGPPNSPPGAVAQGGVFAQPSNIGHYTSSHFSVIPEGEVKLKVRLLDNLTAFAGYNFLYWSNVVRPGNQIDRTINPAQIPSSPVGVFAPGTGTFAPTVPFRQSDFWAQGVSCGLELRF